MFSEVLVSIQPDRRMAPSSGSRDRKSRLVNKDNHFLACVTQGSFALLSSDSPWDEVGLWAVPADYPRRFSVCLWKWLCVCKARRVCVSPSKTPDNIIEVTEENMRVTCEYSTPSLLRRVINHSIGHPDSALPPEHTNRRLHLIPDIACLTWLEPSKQVLPLFSFHFPDIKMMDKRKWIYLQSIKNPFNSSLKNRL